MTWFYSSDEPDTNFTYAHNLRRVRRLSSAVRSAPFQGTDMCVDDMNLWGGKNQTFTWKLIGEQVVLAAFSSSQINRVKNGPDGQMEYKKSDRHTFGYEDPNWKGAAWAVNGQIWTPRTVWVVQGTPKDANYNYGKQIFYVDQNNYTIWYKLIHDRDGEYWKTVYIISNYQVAPNVRTILMTTELYQGIDDRNQHATITQQDFIEGTSPTYSLFLPETEVNPKTYTINNVQQMSK
jgi:hypothetical protein